MGEIARYHSEVDSLALQLEKLLKVINHSDPSAEKMKHVLYKKYKSNLTHLAHDIKQNLSFGIDVLTDHVSVNIS